MSTRTAAGALIACVLAATTLTVIACAPAPVDGTPYGQDGERAARRTRDTKTEGTNETDGKEPTGSTSAAQTQGSALDAGGGTTPTPSVTATTPSPPPVASCQSSSDQACFECCLDANPGAGAVENAYDNCLFNCFDDFCADNCDAQHGAQCNGNAACRGHHACLQANGCFRVGF